MGWKPVLLVAMIAPLDPSELDRLGASEPPESMWHRIPFMGWLAADARWMYRYRPVREAFEEQLRSRPETYGTWSGFQPFHEFALQACEIARREMTWPNARFIPEDPVRLVFWSYYDGLDMESAMMDIGDLLDLDIGYPDIEPYFRGPLGAFLEAQFRRAYVNSPDVAGRSCLISEFRG